MPTMTRTDQSTASMSDHPVTLLVAFELGERSWTLGFTTGIGQRPRVRQIPAGAVDRVLEEVTRATARVGVPVAAPVVSCYEAGRDGFWLHRFLMAHAVTNYVVDSSSIEVPRRARRAKTDKLDLVGLLRLLARYEAGDRGAWRHQPHQRPELAAVAYLPPAEDLRRQHPRPNRANPRHRLQGRRCPPCRRRRVPLLRRPRRLERLTLLVQKLQLRPPLP